ncbi:MAG TPA: undecaprenyl-diphosphatase UppP [Anaerolineae bacterium]|nr:undecaprenyl-diphosphatase UppP [Anaerolineae bacterium]
MSIFQALILGIIQGLTEYIPVSSTAHLILVPWLLGWNFAPDAKVVFDILVQWGTLVGVVIYFWHDIWQIARAVLSGLAHRQPFETFEARLGWLVVVATIPAVIAGIFVKGYLEQLYQMYILISIVLMLGGVLMMIAERFGRRTRELKQMTWLDAVIVGVWQIFAMIPGFSRSSVTISGGMLRHFIREDAARFSFLMSIPALLGAGVIALKDLFGTPGLLASLAAPLAVGFLAAAITGYLSIRWLLGYLKTRSLNIFVIYRFVFGGLCLIVGLIRLAGH